MMAAMTIPPIVDVSFLTDGERDHEVVIADVRSYFDGRVGRDAYRGGHVPGAIFVDLDTDLAAPATTADGRHPLPSPGAFAAAMGRLGIGDDSTVIAYDDAGGSIAARLVWMLRVLGHEAAVLDGGIDAWTDDLETGDLETGEVTRPAATFTAAPWPAAHVATVDDVRAATVDPATTIVDARAAGRFTGEVDSPLDPRPGHVPSARSFPWDGNIDPATRRFHPLRELRDRFAPIANGDRVIVYCGSGVTACHDVLALEQAGFTDVRLFPGSWSAWAADPDNPVETGT